MATDTVEMTFDAREAITPQDVWSSYRLVCGRNPTNIEMNEALGMAKQPGWNHHMMLMFLANKHEGQERLFYKAIGRSGAKIEVVLHNGMKLYGPASDVYVTHTIKRNKGWEPVEAMALLKVVRPGMKVMDVGANIGYFTAILSQAVGPKGHVWSVEMQPPIVECLRQTMEVNRMQNVTLLPYAVSDKEGSLVIEYNYLNFGCSRVRPAVKGEDIDPSWMAQVEARRLDNLVDEKETIGAIKIDVEGHELHALKGMERILKKDKPAILFEYAPGHLRGGGTQPEELLNYLEGFGYKFADTQVLQKVEDLATYYATLGKTAQKVIDGTQNIGLYVNLLAMA